MDIILDDIFNYYEPIAISSDFQMTSTYSLLRNPNTNRNNNMELFLSNILSNSSENNIIITIRNIDLTEHEHDTIDEKSFNEFKESTFENLKNNLSEYTTISELIPQCIICMDDYSDTDTLTILQCGHYFHKDCIKNWLLKYNHICPICKKNCN